MTIELKKFGDVLISRPAGKEAYLVARAYSLPKDRTEEVIIDFAGVDVLAPSWADEFITPIKQMFSRVSLVHTDNPSVQATLEILATN